MYLGGKEIKECPHKTVSRFYDSPIKPVPEWRCDWCGQDFAVAAGASKVVELNEVGTTAYEESALKKDIENLWHPGEAPGTDKSSTRAAVSGPAHCPVLDSGTGPDSPSKVEALPDRSTAPNKRMRRI